MAIAKPILYMFPPSVWCSVATLALEEKGYGKDEIDIKKVDLRQGDQFGLTYLRLNPMGIVPTLVVPVEGSSDPDEESRYRAIKDSTGIAEYLDRSRSTQSQTPSLSPATMEGSTLCKNIIEAVHDPKGADPNFLKRSARTIPELVEAGSKTNVPMFEAREIAIEKSLSETPIGDFKGKTRLFLESKATQNKKMLGIWSNTNPADVEEFIASSKTLWEVNLPQVFAKLEKLIVGPYSLGDEFSLADLHLTAWLARVVSASGGDATPAGLAKVETKVGGEFKIGEKVKRFWVAVISRPSFQAVYKDGLH